MTRRARNHPAQFIPTERRLQQLADLARWWGENITSRILDRSVAEAWEREWAKRQEQDGTQQQQEAQ